MSGSDDFLLGIKLQSLDTSVSYPQGISISAARKGFFLDDKKFVLEKLTPRYIQLSQIQNN
jgi:hypothetical protein